MGKQEQEAIYIYFQRLLRFNLRIIISSDCYLLMTSDPPSVQCFGRLLLGEKMKNVSKDKKGC
jgi:hypothetical protein